MNQFIFTAKIPGVKSKFRTSKLSGKRLKALNIKQLSQKAFLNEDNEDVRLQKSTLLMISLLFSIAGILWAGIYFLNDLTYPGFIPLGYSFVSLISIGYYLSYKNFNVFRFIQLSLIFLLPTLLQVFLGGFVSSGMVIVWAIIAPLGALVFYDLKKSVYWFLAYIASILLVFGAEYFIPQKFEWQLSENCVLCFFVMNIIGISSLIYFLLYYFVGKQTILKKIVEQKSFELFEKNKEITDSINYAKRIQHTMLANNTLLRANLAEHFILFKPKDIVSGDFYWASQRGDKFYLAVCDSTGHGVPGAFMSLLNISFLNEAVNEKNINAPNDICNYIRKRLIESVSIDGAQDGMDGIIICLDRKTNTLTYAAGNNTPILFSENSLVELPSDKMAIGKSEKTESFNEYTVKVNSGDVLYFFTDGYMDQFGGSKGKKFKRKQLLSTFTSLNTAPLHRHGEILEETLINWQGELEQTDDILVLGIKV